MRIKNKKAQSEMVGFAMILIIVTVLLVIFLSFSINNKNDISKNYKITTFLSSMSEVTTLCKESNYDDYLSLQKVISRCHNENPCYNNTNSCEIMNETINEIMKGSWKVGENRPIKGYVLNLKYPNEEDLLIKRGGIVTKKKEGAMLSFPSDDLALQLTIYN